jgi:hypothetical protein
MKLETQLKEAIRKKCIDCCGSLSEAKRCQIKDCPLYPFKLGKTKNKR